MEERPGHVPVMLPEVLAALAPRDGGRYVDGTFGGGGYTAAILAHAACGVWAIDRDPDALARGAALAARFNTPDATRLHLIAGNFGAMADLLGDAAPFDGIVLDIGVSSYQIDEAERGFSFRHNGPLDMRMSRDGRSAADIVNHEDEHALADILYHYGEERMSRRIARAIVAARAEAPFETTEQLAALIRKVVRPDRSGIDPATRSFQALRIAVNDELGALQSALEQAPALLAPGGKLVIVTFHSLEDRLVKQSMATLAGRNSRPSRHEPMALAPSAGPAFALGHSRPVTASTEEVRANPRARSARLRTLVRLPVPNTPTGQMP
ncbi:16S rRNA (cytosine(1402)-N(4))-methyltransferase RsmH [Acidomonas methanolica]|uniref:16S rRNA (cytosine(1402)-N(4))-methyltransferase RsmH n=1 Tax=Acidomonas methanolica TaxID=437 RepID=UPI00211A76C8|nr:16S rRNA (cytosine(1402)-N(4))-methyltransferase RsmH [Acidomonas methanolica]